jgi:hypothetical protein
MEITKNNNWETIFLWKHSKEEIIAFLRKECKWVEEFSRTGDPRLWGTPIKTEGNTSEALLKEGNTVQISPSGYVDVIQNGRCMGEGFLPNTSAGDDYIIIQL